jgi:hypothetical protein
MPNPLEDLAPKPYKNEESLFRGVTMALQVFGRCLQPLAIFRVHYQLSPDLGEYEEAHPGWVLTVKLEGFGDLKLNEAADRVNVDELNPQAIFAKDWQARGATIQAAGEDLRKAISAALEDVLSQRRADVVTAEQALTALKSGVSPEDIWGDPAEAEASLEKAVSVGD